MFPTGCEITLLLDLVEESLSVYRDSKYVDVMKGSLTCLTGQYCWEFYCWLTIKIDVNRLLSNISCLLKSFESALPHYG